MKRIEILAPAGSYESMTAAINAGVDAVYMGGSRFGARAFADNPDEKLWLQGIDYAHLHGCRLYMTVNTLTKETELADLSEYLRPFYQQGLDAVIVQDMGVFSLIKTCYPDLPIHASTQMTITGYHGARLLKEFGAARVVLARELSLAEITRIRDEVGIEIECFVHGALCYGYSGQCLLSSFIGGRSGNRGRCAQPCRLPYITERSVNHSLQSTKMGVRGQPQGNERYIMSLKDLCTLDIIPELLEAGVYSLKIEGRMKSPRYTAGVVSIYRKYVDRYLTYGREGYRVSDEDKTMLLELFDRGGLTAGYYRQHNGRSMVVLKEKPAFRAANQALFDYLDETYVKRQKQEPIDGGVEIAEGKPCRLDLRLAGGPHEWMVSVSGAVVQTAKNQPLGKERIAAQLEKTGNTPFTFADLQIRLEGSCFLPMQELNELRRLGLGALEAELAGGYRRDAAAAEQPAVETVSGSAADGNGKSDNRCLFHVTMEKPQHLPIVLAEPLVDEISVDAVGFAPEIWLETVRLCHQAGKVCRLIMPHIFREEAEWFFLKNMEILIAAGFDGMLLRSLEEVDFLREQGVRLPFVTDYMMYGMNHLACEYFNSVGAVRQTFPVELNARELQACGDQGRSLAKELIVYGYLPAMVSAQCIVKTTGSCTQKPEVLYLKDRLGKRLPVRNHCRFCYNTVYNPHPLSLLGLEKDIRRLHPAALRMQLTIEAIADVKLLLHVYTEHFCHGRTVENPSPDYTRGHFKRGVE